MPAPDLSDTQPRRVKGIAGQTRAESTSRARSKWRFPWKAGLTVVALVLLVMLTGALLGWSSARRSQVARQASQTDLTLQQQYELGVQDLQEGRYDVAIQRFEFILAQDPGFPGATERLAEAMGVLFTTATPTPPAATPTPTSTPDPRPVQEMFQSALQLVASQNWSGAIDSLTALRKADQTYMTARVDGLLFLSLRSRGVQKIYNERNLQGGIYDLAVAERFGPIDGEAGNARNLARLYLYGVSFWEVDWGKAVEYFSQVAAALPNLTDASGLSASERYRTALIGYGDQLAAAEDWCSAQSQYEQALSIRADSELQEKQEAAALMCQGPSETPTTTGESATPSATPTGPLPSATSTVPVINTPTATLGIATPTATQPAATEPATQAPTATQPAPTPYPAPATQEPGQVPQAGAGWSGLALAIFWLAASLVHHRTIP